MSAFEGFPETRILSDPPAEEHARQEQPEESPERGEKEPPGGTIVPADRELDRGRKVEHREHRRREKEPRAAGRDGKHEARRYHRERRGHRLPGSPQAGRIDGREHFQAGRRVLVARGLQLETRNVTAHEGFYDRRLFRKTPTRLRAR